VGSRVDIQAAEQTAHPNCGPRRRPSITWTRARQHAQRWIFPPNVVLVLFCAAYL